MKVFFPHIFYVKIYFMDSKNLHNPCFNKIGYIQVYTGDGKGKTTAGLGLALRALGRGWKVLIVMFTKGGSNYGEIHSFSKPFR